MHFLDRPSLFNRPDTFLGVCQGLGEDLGIYPNLIRLAFAGLLFWNPMAAFCTYAAAGVLVLATRLLAPVPTTPEAERPEAVAGLETASAEEQEQLPLAA
jgi:phage shock protein PspC (stress-responsive transcriptional regulator)